LAIYDYIFVDYSVIITVGGVMAFLTLHEMLPLAFEYAGQKQSVKAVFCGMAFMSARY
jgi:ZIP family zinc transporter